MGENKRERMVKINNTNNIESTELYKKINKICWDYFNNGLTEDNLFELVDELYFKLKGEIMTKENLFTTLLDEAETFGELPEEIEGQSKQEYLQRLTEEQRDELDDIITFHAEQAWENHLSDFYGSSSPQTLEEKHKKAVDTKQKLR